VRAVADAHGDVVEASAWVPEHWAR
jgi:hypothetical protein